MYSRLGSKALDRLEVRRSPYDRMTYELQGFVFKDTERGTSSRSPFESRFKFELYGVKCAVSDGARI